MKGGKALISSISESSFGRKALAKISSAKGWNTGSDGGVVEGYDDILCVIKFNNINFRLVALLYLKLRGFLI